MQCNLTLVESPGVRINRLRSCFPLKDALEFLHILVPVLYSYLAGRRAGGSQNGAKQTRERVVGRINKCQPPGALSR